MRTVTVDFPLTGDIETDLEVTTTLSGLIALGDGDLYVAARKILTRFADHHTTVDFSEELARKLLAQLDPGTYLHTHISRALEEAEDDPERQRTERPNRESVRQSRDFRFPR